MLARGRREAPYGSTTAHQPAKDATSTSPTTPSAQAVR